LMAEMTAEQTAALTTEPMPEQGGGA